MNGFMHVAKALQDYMANVATVPLQAQAPLQAQYPLGVTMEHPFFNVVHVA
jgi:hypothetical protein